MELTPLRDSIFILEGLLEQQTGLNPNEIMTHTAGAGESVFWHIDKDADYGILNELSRSCANPQWTSTPL